MEVVYSCPRPLDDTIASLCRSALSVDKDALQQWRMSGVLDATTLSALKRTLDNEHGPDPNNLAQFLREHSMTPILRPQQSRLPAAVDTKESWRDGLRARQQHRDYQDLVANLRKGEIEQVCVTEALGTSLLEGPHNPPIIARVKGIHLGLINSN